MTGGEGINWQKLHVQYDELSFYSNFFFCELLFTFQLLSVPRVAVIYGSKETSEEAWRQACTALDGTCTVDFVCRNPSDPPHSANNPLSTRIPYGVHHSKIFLVGYSTGGLRVIIHTANLRYSDIHHKAQAAYIQDFPRKNSSSPTTSAFEEDLISYMETYQFHKQYRWDDSYTDSTPPKDDRKTTATTQQQRTITLVEQLRKYDFSEASVVLIPSTPGYHELSEEHPIGHLKLRKAISELATKEAVSGGSGNQNNNNNNISSNSPGPIICQFSSIGSLTKKYLHRLEASLDVTKAGAAANSVDSVQDESKPLNLQLVYPTADEICNSLEGYRGGRSVPGTSKNVSKDFLQPLFRKWSEPQSFLASLTASRNSNSNSNSSSNNNANSNNDKKEGGIKNPLWKGSNVPHIKTYYQLGSSNEKEDPSMLWFCVGSHNLSKAALGDDIQSKIHGGPRFFVRHWELSVFVAPSMLNARRLVPFEPDRKMPCSSSSEEDVTIPLPYRPWPLPYSASDKPWAVDQRYVRLDIFGRRSASDA